MNCPQLPFLFILFPCQTATNTSEQLSAKRKYKFTIVTHAYKTLRYITTSTQNILEFSTRVGITAHQQKRSWSSAQY